MKSGQWSAKCPLPPGHTALSLYELAMAKKWYLVAATIGKTYGLDKPLINQAAFAAFCRLDDLGQSEMALEVLREFQLNLITARPDLLQLMQAFGELPSGVIVTGPREIQ